MTDQFSQEYIDYILSDGQGLQEKWEPKAGHWVWSSDSVVLRSTIGGRPAYKPWLVVQANEQTKVLWVWAPSRYNPGLHTDEVVWLPTLWDLVQIRVGKVRPPDNEVAEMASVLEWIASEALENAEPIMLAAAKLAVKASES